MIEPATPDQVAALRAIYAVLGLPGRSAEGLSRDAAGKILLILHAESRGDRSLKRGAA